MSHDQSRQPDRFGDGAIESMLRGGATPTVLVSGDFAPLAIARRRRTQRRKAVGAAVACAAVVAVAAPLVSDLADHAKPSIPATRTTSVTPSPPPSTTGADGAWSLDSAIHIGDQTVELPTNLIIDRFALLTDGRIAVESHPSGKPNRLEIWDRDGDRVQHVYTQDDGGPVSWAASSGGDHLVVDRPRSVTVHDSEGRQVAALPTNQDLPDGARETHALNIAGDTVYLSTDETVEWRFADGTTRVLPRDVAAVSPDGTRAVSRVSKGGRGCLAVVDLTTTDLKEVTTKCDGLTSGGGWVTPVRFSADGEHILGEFMTDGAGFHYYALLRTTDLELLAGVLGVTDKETGDPVPEALAGWTARIDADDTLLLSRATRKATGEGPIPNALVRCTLSGECTDVAPEVDITDGRNGRYVVAD